MSTHSTPAAAASETARFLNAQGTQVLKTTVAAVAVGDSIYTAASGLCSNTSTSATLLGIALVVLPFAVGMFDKAPRGAAMMGAFETIETTLNEMTARQT